MRTQRVRHLASAMLVVLLTAGCLPMRFNIPYAGQIGVNSKPQDGVTVEHAPRAETEPTDLAKKPAVEADAVGVEISFSRV